MNEGASGGRSGSGVHMLVTLLGINIGAIVFHSQVGIVPQVKGARVLKSLV